MRFYTNDILRDNEEVTNIIPLHYLLRNIQFYMLKHNFVNSIN